MSRLPGDRPERERNFHDKDGVHQFPHPSTYEPRKSLWTASERRYAAHLEEHERQATDPSPLPGDGPAVTAIFEHIECLRSIVEKEKQLIVALRQKAAQYPEADGRDDELTVRRMLRGGRDSS